MTSITERNAAKLAERNGTSLPSTGKARKATPAAASAPAPEKPETKAAPVPVACGCGCGAEAKPGRSYLPGHDARHAGEVARRIVAGAPEEATLAELGSAKLREKAARFVSNRRAESARKAAAARIREQAAADLKAALAAI